MDAASTHETESEKKERARQATLKASSTCMYISSNWSQRMAQKERTEGSDRLFFPKLN